MPKCEQHAVHGRENTQHDSPMRACSRGKLKVAATPVTAPKPLKMLSRASLMPLQLRKAVIRDPSDSTVRYSRASASAAGQMSCLKYVRQADR